MKHLFFALFSLIFLAGCGKKEKTEPQGQTKAPEKPAAPVSKQEPPKPKKPGTVLWAFDTVLDVVSSPAIGSGGTVYVGSGDYTVYALDGKTGAKKWEFETGEAVSSSPAIGANGTVYVGSGDKKIYALNGKTGAKIWEFETGGGVAAPALGANGTV